MERHFDLVVFDWDGTIVDSADHIVGSIQAAAIDLSLPVPSDQQARYIIGLGLSDAMSLLFPGLASQRYGDVSARYSHHFLAANHHIRPFPGAAEMLQKLNDDGYVVGIATGKSRKGLARSLQETGLARFFHVTRCADEGFAKPHPGMLQYLMDEVVAHPSRTLMIGDTTHDVNMAHNAGTPAIAVSYGAHPKEDLLALSPLACVDTVTELAEWLSANG
jgi:phosphoglycolate phosphatase